MQISPRHESKKQCNVSDPGEDLRDDKEPEESVEGTIKNTQKSDEI